MQNVIKIKYKTAMDLEHIGGDLRVMLHMAVVWQ